MNEFYCMISIAERSRLRDFLNYYKRSGVQVGMVSLAYGTAVSETLNALGLEATEKVVISSFVTRESWNRLKPGLKKELEIDLPGNGIVFIVPMSSVGGKKQLSFLVQGQPFAVKEESKLTDTKYELLIVISNIGYSERVMDAARSANAGGGTVLHAKGTGMQGAEQFLGVTLASEKEMIYIVVQKDNKNIVMRAIMDKVGLDSKAQSVVFSLPVTATAGLRFPEPETEDLPDAAPAENSSASPD